MIRRILAALALAIMAGSALAYSVTAHWTGRSQYTQSVSGRMVLACEFRYLDKTFWRASASWAYCPSSIEIE